MPTDTSADIPTALGQRHQRLTKWVIQREFPSEGWAATPGTGPRLGDPSTRGIDVPTPCAFALDNLPGPRSASQGAQHGSLELDDTKAGRGLLGRYLIPVTWR